MNTFKQALEQEGSSPIRSTITTIVDEEKRPNNILQHMFPVHPSASSTMNNTQSVETSNVSNCDTNEHNNIDRWIPLAARLASVFDCLVATPRKNTGRLLLDTLINKHHLWRKFNELFGFYYMLAGQSWHRFCDALFTKVNL
jgi:hypothetical protein